MHMALVPTVGLEDSLRERKFLIFKLQEHQSVTDPAISLTVVVSESARKSTSGPSVACTAKQLFGLSLAGKALNNIDGPGSKRPNR